MKRIKLFSSGPTWVMPVSAEHRAEIEAYKHPSVVSWAAPWLQTMFLENPIPKLAVGSMAAALLEGSSVIAIPLMYVLFAWLADFVVGVARALSDPTVQLSSAKATRGVVKALVIPWLLVFPALAERLTMTLMGFDVAGKYVTVVAAVMVWDLAASAQRNGRFFFKSLLFKRGWFGGGPPDGEGGGGSDEAKRYVTEKEAEAARKQLEVGERLAGMAEREKGESAVNGRTGAA